MKILLLFLLSITLTSPILAVEISGNCGTHQYEDTDVFTDEITHSYFLICASGDTEIVFFVKANEAADDEFGIFLKTDYQRYYKDFIRVIVRIDQNPLYKARWQYRAPWRWNSGKKWAFMFSKYDIRAKKHFVELLEQLVQGHYLYHNLYIAVGDKSGTIPLEGAAQAATIFKERIAHLDHFKDVF